MQKFAENAQPIHIVFIGWARVWILKRFGLHVQQSTPDDHSTAKPP
jgi:hypothetical protein